MIEKRPASAARGARGPASARRERTFELSLRARVRGCNPRDQEFQVHSRLASLSAEEATLRLPSKVPVGTKLHVWLDVPKTHLLEIPLQMALSGTVRSVQSDSSACKNDWLIVIRLDKGFRIFSRAA